MENIDVVSSDKENDVAPPYAELDRGIATQVDNSKRDSNPPGRAMDRQREAQEYIRSRRAQATVADETDEETTVDRTAQFPQAPNTSRDTEANEQKLLATLANKYKYNLYQSNPAKENDPKLSEISGSPVKSEQTLVIQQHRKEPSSSSQTRQNPEGHDPWRHSLSQDPSSSPPLHRNTQRTPSPSLQLTESTQITPSPPPPIPTAPISDFPGPIFSTSHMSYPSQNPRPTYTTNLRQYGDRTNRFPANKSILQRNSIDSMPGNSVNGLTSDRYRHNQIVAPQPARSHSPQMTTQWAAPKPARANSNLVKNLQESQALQISEPPLQTTRPPPDSYLAHDGPDVSRQNLEPGNDSMHQRAPEHWNQNNRIPQQNFSPPDSLSSNSRRQLGFAFHNNTHSNPEPFAHSSQPGYLAPMQRSNPGHGHETYAMHEPQGHRNYGYENHHQEAFSPPTTIPNQLNFTPSSHGNSTQGRAPDYRADRQFEVALDEQRPPPMHPSSTAHHHLNAIDWRGQLCQLFNAPPESHDEELFKMLDMTRTKLTISDRPEFDPERFSLPYHTIHRIRCQKGGQVEMFLDNPWIADDVSSGSHIHGSIVVRDIGLHIKQYTNLAFIVFKDYRCCKATSSSLHQVGSGVQPDIDQFIDSESVCLLSEELSAGLKRLTRQNIHENPYYPSFNVGAEFQAPYPWFYHQRAPLEERRRQLKPELLSRVNSFVEYVNDNFGKEYAVVDSLLNKGMVSQRYLRYLYSPDTVVLRADEDFGGSRKRAYLTKSWLHLSQGIQDELNVPAPATSSLVVSSWTFDGFFEEKLETIKVEDSKYPNLVIKITSLDICPLRFADSGIAIALRKQGETFWKFRRGSYVYYREDEDGLNETVGQSRYMIDVETYKKFNADAQKLVVPNRDELGPTAMTSDSPPEGVFTLLLPNKIMGFSMQDKTWVDLDVSRIYPIKWHKDAFDLLATDENSRLLVKALVVNQVMDEQDRGFLGSKTNASIILLHGASGTGKSSTAESVAEIAEKPLYRVDCSELTTSVVHLGNMLSWIVYLAKMWNCVVLLEEAEVFLEKRTLRDTQRSVLVSIFLRFIEAFSGILILTSTPLTTIDPVVKSRIQLCLRYGPLTPAQRQKIWESHITQLGALESLFTPSTINIAELRSNISALSNYPLNGHEIGHAVKSARQLAMWKGVPMGFAEVEFVLETVGNYKKKEQHELSNEQVAKVKAAIMDERNGNGDPYNGLEGVEDLMNV